MSRRTPAGEAIASWADSVAAGQRRLLENLRRRHRDPIFLSAFEATLADRRAADPRFEVASRHEASERSLGQWLEPKLTPIAARSEHVLLEVPGQLALRFPESAELHAALNLAYARYRQQLVRRGLAPTSKRSTLGASPSKDAA